MTVFPVVVDSLVGYARPYHGLQAVRQTVGRKSLLDFLPGIRSP